MRSATEEAETHGDSAASSSSCDPFSLDTHLRCNNTVSYTCLKLSYKLKLIFERQEIVLLRARAGGGFVRQGRSGVEAGGGTVEHGLLGRWLGQE
ncbi:hypothetical protein E2C01_062625 [Portunus trituberculatus]|uniref:Uncharacterized protein n=1 Tax=Portunus trituberculatus TaxID=210409 RepID=A0A5B7HIK1_PORTR|nr:hypothetical protein [Portunus trituberculatus]